VAGTWYPGEANELAATVDGYLAAVRPMDGVPQALVVPHAGYRYSGAVAAAGFKQLAGTEVEVAVILAADHQPPISRPISVWARGGFETPLGVVPVDEEAADRLLEIDPRFRFDPDCHAQEHPLEIEVPFLQRVLPNCKILPILMAGDADEEVIGRLAEGLLTVLSGKQWVVVASSDLSHYPPYEEAVRIDRATLGAIELGEAGAVRQAIRSSLQEGVPGLVTCACGEAPILVAMRTARSRGATHVTLLDYANSGDVEVMRRDQVVGYASLMFWRHEPPVLDAAQRTTLLRLARTAAEAEARSRPEAGTPEGITDPVLRRLSAVFVTLRVEGELRGCIGQLRPDTELYLAVGEKARAAAAADPRFPSLTEAELPGLGVEISLISPLERLAEPRQFEVGKHGLAIFDQGKKGVLLPKVASERNWGRDEFLENTALKAGLPPHGWETGAALYRFESLEIRESH
jgi:hypothetical protein